MDNDGKGSVKRRLMIEAHVAAGPRKSEDEYKMGAKELCEDCAGYRAIGEFVIFWICDGTSEGHELPRYSSHPGFNNRILAQDIGEGFAKIVGEGVVKATVCKPGLQKTLFAEIAENWENRLREYFTVVENEGELEYIFKRMPRVGEGLYRMKWSSTFLGGVYNGLERTLDIVNIGDSGAIISGKELSEIKPKKTREILLASISRNDIIAIEVSSIVVDIDWEHCEEVECFIAMSDGISRDVIALLRELRESKSQSIGEMRHRLLMRGELSYDDQAVIIGRLLP